MNNRNEAWPILVDAVKAFLAGDDSTLTTRLDRLGGLPRAVVVQAAAVQLEDAVGLAWERGWQPRDLAAVARRTFEPLVATIVVGATVAQVQGHRNDRSWCAHEWRSQVDAITADGSTSGGGGPDWLAELLGASPGPAADVAHLVVAAGGLLQLPDLPLLLPPPSAWRHQPRQRQGHPEATDPDLLRRVRALLAQAESTSFPDEAETFTAKAQQLMARHRIDRALLEVPATDRGPEGRRVHIDDPYTDAKYILLQCVAHANGCRSVWSNGFGFATVFGTAVDLELVETLFTSLLVQATTAMRAAGSRRDASGRSRTRSFRRSFLLSFAHRIGERLEEQVIEVRDDLDADERARALPVLARQAAEVDEAFSTAFPSLLSQTVTMSNGEGWAAGRIAADQADLARGPSVR